MNCTTCGALIPAGETSCPGCGATRRAGEDVGLAPGTVIAGKYKLLEEIGAGGMGRVYRAVQQPLDLEVCIKTLHHGASADPAFPARFEREARTTSRLRHPNIVQIIDFGTHVDGSMYLVMEFIRGQSLANVAKKGRALDERRAVHILGQVCDALAAAHFRGVLHRDLKPANIMVQDLPEKPDFVKVLDFGSALILEGAGEAQRLTQVGTVIGTPGYMAPEHILGKGLDARVDVYAVGVLLYRLLCGETPFQGSTQSVLAQHVTVKPDPPSRRNPDATISPLLERVTMRALVKDPARRYATAQALKEAMERALRGEADADAGADGDEAALAVEVASTDRTVLVVSVRGAYRLEAEVTTRVTAVGQTFGAQVETAGETVYLLFGLDRESPSVTADAVRCALDLARKEQARPVRIGIHDARASCHGRYGTPGFRYELYGEGRARASALASAAANRQVLIGGAAARTVPVRHRLVPVPVGADVAGPAFDVDGGAFTPASAFVGRDAERRQLLERALADTGGTTLVVGPEGCGKSRLVDEVASAAALLDVRWVVVRPTAGGEIGPSHPAAALAALGWNTERGLDPAVERHAVALLGGGAGEAEDGPAGDRRQARAISAAVAGIGSRAAEGRLAIVVDDLHLADDLTASLVRRLHEVAPTIGFALVVGVRAERALAFEPPPETLRIKVGPLSRREMTGLVETRLRGEADQVLLDRAVAATLGHPLLGEEVARAVNDGCEALLDLVDGKPPLEAVDLLVAQRIERLSQPARQVLKAAAVLGLEPRQDELAELGEAFDDLAALMELESRGVLSRCGTNRLRFPFPRVRQVALAATPARELERLHRRAAEVVAVAADAARRQLELGDHLSRSGQVDSAFAVYRAAARSAQGDGMLRDAREALRRAAEVARRADGRRGAASVEVARDLGDLLIQTGDVTRAEEVLREASTAAREVGDAALATDVLRLHGNAVVLLGDAARGLEELEACLRFAESRGDHAAGLRVGLDLVDAAEKSGRADRADEALDRARALAAKLRATDHAPARILLANRVGRRELARGNGPGAIATFAEALDLAEKVGDRHQAAGLLGNLGGAYARLAKMAEATHFTERALRASEDLGDDLGISRQSFNLALLRLATGQVEAASTLLRGSEAAATRSGWAEGLAMSRAAAAKLQQAGAPPPGPAR